MPLSGSRTIEMHPAGADTRLAVYGTLASGRANHHMFAPLRGIWQPGIVRGRLVHEGWGAAMGFPGLRLDPEGDEIEVHLFTSPDLPSHWSRLDAFEGDGYRRLVARVAMADGAVDACIYVVASSVGTGIGEAEPM